MTEEDRNFYLAQRKYKAEWRKKNSDKVKAHMKKFYLKQMEKFMLDAATSDIE